MKISKLILKNVRSHKMNEVNLEKGITVFTGRTGSGKSSILMALEYALFGSEAGISNSAIFRRSAESGEVELEFEENGETYKIIRGVKRQKDKFQVDVNRMVILKNGSPLPLLGRATDLNQKILDILNYPAGIKAKELFEITSYSRQDEIRSLIEMKPEGRQEYIDKILQLSRYKHTWDNLKEVLNHYELQLKELEGRVANEEVIKKEANELENRVEKTKELLKKIGAETVELSSKSIEIHKVISRLEEKRNQILEKRRSYDQSKGMIEGLEKENQDLKKKTEALGKRKQDFEKEFSRFREIENLDELQKKNISVIKTIELKEKQLSEITDEFNKVKELGEGKCPACKQPVTKEHLKSLDKEFNEIISKIREEISRLGSEEKEIRPKLDMAKQAEEIKDSLEKVSEDLKEYEERSEKNNTELMDLHSKLASFKFNSEEFQKLESELKEKNKSKEELISQIQSLEKEQSIRREELNSSARNLMDKRKMLAEVESDKSKINNIKDTTGTLSRLREDIRNIREIVRINFLEDFRQEFQKKFEEIRKYEEEYGVNIKSDYEPFAVSSNGEEVPIPNLSGGEKTSVALAYRLALANLAAQVSAVNPSEILILDEPTTGLDQEDIKALPEALRNIQAIPQIIIVTHEEELKNAADYKFEIKKESGKSIIKEV